MLQQQHRDVYILLISSRFNARVDGARLGSQRVRPCVVENDVFCAPWHPTSSVVMVTELGRPALFHPLKTPFTGTDKNAYS
jgi:hypothetical protein